MEYLNIILWSIGILITIFISFIGYQAYKNYTNNISQQASTKGNNSPIVQLANKKEKLSDK